ncbi:acyl-CoA dehydrogenase family protein [Pseudonocardia acaciae]|uniref:acyl-CoA dehydrogenase family protein n=1 Tax=Pseudonocardia acaciae TaxID=551276 RepID=UPI000684C441|nr:acyl-CoA dehydrogenase family protein [Pseudonocardia acaciae]
MSSTALETLTVGYPGREVSAPGILAAAERLYPMIDAQVPAIREAGKLPDELMASLREAGVFRAAFPAAWGGPEMCFVDQVTLIEGLARHDASVGWACMILFDSGFFAGQFPREIAEEIYPSMDMATAVSEYPPGRAVRDGEDYRVTGRFKFGSGSYNADMFVCPTMLPDGDGLLLDEDGKPVLALFFVPRERVTIHDTWHTIGLQGTGSTDYSVDNLLVPSRHMCRLDKAAVIEDRPPLSRYHHHLVLSQFGVILGLTRHILDELNAAARTRVSTSTRQPIKEEYPVLTGVPEAEAMWGAARAYVYEYARATDEIVFQDRPLTREHNAKLPLVGVALAQLCRRAVDQALELVGTDAIHTARPWEQLYQDFRVAASHVVHRRPYYREAMRRMEH